MRSGKSSYQLSSKLALSVRHGFTLVELLVVIAIIGILMGIAVPAIFGVIGTAKSNKQRLEIGGIEQAVERYQEKYGDYPPDFSDWTIVERHYRKIFPRISYGNGVQGTPIGDLDRLRLLLAGHPLAQGTATYTQNVNLSGLVHNPIKINRAKAVVWTLGGYSSNPINPFTGDGGPLASLPDNAFAYQINLDRDNALYEFDTTRLDLKIRDKDELISLANNNFYTSSDDDPFPSYAAADDGAPFVYFDARTYAFDAGAFGLNGYASPEFGNVRPYLSTQRTGDGGSWTFLNPDTFQVIAPGIDNNFGKMAFTEQNPSTVVGNAVYFQYPTGKAVFLNKASSPPWGLIPNVSRYQEPVAWGLADNFQQDNLTNFADGKLIDELAE